MNFQVMLEYIEQVGPDASDFYLRTIFNRNDTIRRDNLKNKAAASCNQEKTDCSEVALNIFTFPTASSCSDLGLPSGYPCSFLACQSHGDCTGCLAGPTLSPHNCSHREAYR